MDHGIKAHQSSQRSPGTCFRAPSRCWELQSQQNETPPAMLLSAHNVRHREHTTSPYTRKLLSQHEHDGCKRTMLCQPSLISEMGPSKQQFLLSETNSDATPKQPPLQGPYLGEINWKLFLMQSEFRLDSCWVQT